MTHLHKIPWSKGNLFELTPEIILVRRWSQDLGRWEYRLGDHAGRVLDEDDTQWNDADTMNAMIALVVG